MIKTWQVFSRHPLADCHLLSADPLANQPCSHVPASKGCCIYLWLPRHPNTYVSSQLALHFSKSLGAFQAPITGWRPLDFLLHAPSENCFLVVVVEIVHSSCWMFRADTFLVVMPTTYTTIIAAPSSTFFSDLNSKSCHESWCWRGRKYS